MTNIRAVGVSHTSIRLTWGPPQCPYGTITRYRIFFRQSDVVQPPEGAFEVETGYDTIETSNLTLERLFGGLRIYTNYTFIVQAFVAGENGDIAGEIVLEVRNRTHSFVPPTPPTPSPPVEPTVPATVATISIVIPDPTLIDTGRVM